MSLQHLPSKSEMVMFAMLKFQPVNNYVYSIMKWWNSNVFMTPVSYGSSLVTALIQLLAHWIPLFHSYMQHFCNKYKQHLPTGILVAAVAAYHSPLIRPIQTTLTHTVLKAVVGYPLKIILTKIKTYLCSVLVVHSFLSLKIWNKKHNGTN
jgi:hypothetical protein